MELTNAGSINEKFKVCEIGFFLDSSRELEKFITMRECVGPIKILKLGMFRVWYVPKGNITRSWRRGLSQRNLIKTFYYIFCSLKSAEYKTFYPQFDLNFVSRKSRIFFLLDIMSFLYPFWWCEVMHQFLWIFLYRRITVLRCFSLLRTWKLKEPFCLWCLFTLIRRNKHVTKGSANVVHEKLSERILECFFKTLDFFVVELGNSFSKLFQS